MTHSGGWLLLNLRGEIKTLNPVGTPWWVWCGAAAGQEEEAVSFYIIFIQILCTHNPLQKKMDIYHKHGDKLTRIGLMTLQIINSEQHVHMDKHQRPECTWLMVGSLVSNIWKTGGGSVCCRTCRSCWGCPHTAMALVRWSTPFS